MTTGPGIRQPHALDAIRQDVSTFQRLLFTAREHKQAPLIFHGLAPVVSMFVVESHDALIELVPEFRNVLTLRHSDILRASRHRAKLLDDSSRRLADVLSALSAIAESERRAFTKPHTGLLGPLKRWIQPDLGLSVSDGHVFSTSHMVVYNLGNADDMNSSGFSLGVAWGAYLADVMAGLHIPVSHDVTHDDALGEIEMLDIKGTALYRRGSAKTMPLDHAIGVTLVLTSLNFARHVLAHLLPHAGPTLFRLKFITAFHADSSLRKLQNSLRANSVLSDGMKKIFAEALGNVDSRWLRSQKHLRNLLVHYVARDHLALARSPETSRTEMIEHACGTRCLEDVDLLLDRHIAHLARTIEAGLQLTPRSFAYGRVK